MVRHPKPSIIAKQLRHLADTLDDEGDRAVLRASVLAARGYPSSTSGSGISTGRSDTSSTERAAGLPGNDKGLTPPPFAGLDEALAKQLRVLWATALRVAQTIADIHSHASDDDPIPAGTGYCKACDLFVRPSGKKPGFRLRAGLCPRDYHDCRRWRLACREAGIDASVDDYIYARWREDNPEGTTEQYLEWRKSKVDPDRAA